MGLVGGQDERNEVFAGEAPIVRRAGGRRDFRCVESIEFFDVVDDYCEVVGVGEEVLFEFGGEAGEARVVVAQGCFVFFAEPGTGEGEFGEVSFDEVPRFGVEVGAVEGVADAADSFVEGTVEADGVVVCCQLWCDDFFEGICCSVAVGGGWPLFSSGSMVLSKLGASVCAVMASISVSCSAMPFSNAGA